MRLPGGGAPRNGDVCADESCWPVAVSGCWDATDFYGRIERHLHQCGLWVWLLNLRGRSWPEAQLNNPQAPEGETALSLVDDLEKARLDARLSKCGTCGYYAELSANDRAAFDEAAADPELSTAELHRICGQNGLSIGRSVFLTHMRDHHGRP